MYAALKALQRRGSRKLAAAFILSMLATSASAQVYKCSKGGRVAFSDRPCKEASTLHLATAPGPRGSLDFQVPVRHYPINGTDLASAVASMRRNNPGGFAGFARWKVNYRVERIEAGGACVVDAAHVQVIGDILTPEWFEERQAAPQAAWRAAYARLKIHEDGQVQHGREFALLLKEQILGLGRMPCSDLDARVQREYESLLANQRQRDAEYDQRTSHGLRQQRGRIDWRFEGAPASE